MYLSSKKFDPASALNKIPGDKGEKRRRRNKLQAVSAAGYRAATLYSKGYRLAAMALLGRAVVEAKMVHWETLALKDAVRAEVINMGIFGPARPR